MYKHYDKADAAISLHDSGAEKATFENGILTFHFPQDGFWVLPDHEKNTIGEPVRTDASEVRFHLLSEDAEEDFHCYVFHEKSERKSVRKEWTLSELVSAINSREYRLEFLYRYEGGYKELIFSCELWGEKKPYHRECQLWLSVQDVTYCWNEIAECYRE